MMLPVTRKAVGQQQLAGGFLYSGPTPQQNRYSTSE
jgi:hypothetical protein